MEAILEYLRPHLSDDVNANVALTDFLIHYSTMADPHLSMYLNTKLEDRTAIAAQLAVATALNRISSQLLAKNA